MCLLDIMVQGLMKLIKVVGGIQVCDAIITVVCRYLNRGPSCVAEGSCVCLGKLRKLSVLQRSHCKFRELQLVLYFI